MASMVAKGSSVTSTQVSPLLSVQEKGSRNKRKFRADPPLGDQHKIIPSPLTECPGTECLTEKFEITSAHGHGTACDMCGISQGHPDGLKLDLGLSTAVVPSEVGPSQTGSELEASEFQDADWSDLTESQLEELVLSNLDAIFKSAIKKIITCGFSEKVASRAVLRSGICYGNKDTVSNIVDNALAFLRSGQETTPSREHCFEDLQQLERYILAELVCVLREVRPFFSTGDAMWCLLICDMNVSHACAMDDDPVNSFLADGASNKCNLTSNQPQLKTEVKNSELNHNNPCKSVQAAPCCHASHPEAPTFGVPDMLKSKNSLVDGLIPEKEGTKFSPDVAHNKTFSAVHSSAGEEKFVSSRKVHSSSTKKEFILRQKSLHLEKTYRAYGSKGSLRAGKLSGLSSLILDKKLKSVSDSTTINVKNASLKISKAVGGERPQDGTKENMLANSASITAALNVENGKSNSAVSKSSTKSVLPPASKPPTSAAASNLTALSTADTELSLSMPSKSSTSPLPVNTTVAASNYNCGGIRYESSVQWVPQDKKDEMILKLVPRVRELQNQLQEWTEWANQKVMQAARRLSKDKAELKALRQEKEEVEQLNRDKQTMEENTMKKLAEMENALCKAGGQVERANAAVRRLEVERSILKREMEAAKLRAVDSTASYQEVLKREQKTSMKLQSWDKQKSLLQEELKIEKCKVSQMIRELEQTKVRQEQVEARWEHEVKAKEELLAQASSIKKEREQIEGSAKLKENMIKSKAESSLLKHKEDTQKLEKEISQLRVKTDSSKIAALRRGIDGSYAGRVAETRNSPVPPAPEQKEARSHPPVLTDLRDISFSGGLKRERECVMCLSEEMSVVFLPCAHQVVCTTCNELHEKQGMKDCPSCRSPIQRRIAVRYAS